MVFDARGEQDFWNELDIVSFEALAKVIACALERVAGGGAGGERDERLALALEGAGLAMWDLDLESGDLFLDKRWEVMFGRSCDSIPKDMHGWIDLIHPDDVDRVVNSMDEHFSGKESRFLADFRIGKKSDDWRWVRASGRVVIRDDGGKAVRASGTFLDIDKLALPRFSGQFSYAATAA